MNIKSLFSFSPDLSWRDVQHLIAITSQRTGNFDEWRKNGAGMEYSLKNGFGAINAELLVNAGKFWKNLPPQKEEQHSFFDFSKRRYIYLWVKVAKKGSLIIKKTNRIYDIFSLINFTN